MSDLDERVKALEERIARLERQVAVLLKKSAAPAPNRSRELRERYDELGYPER